jgi:HD-GYP domain-containing protein (c-di-GMP phosphodiesterase class II)
MPPPAYRRVLLHGAEPSKIVALLPNEGITPRPFHPASCYLEKDEIAIVLADETVAANMGQAPPGDLGEGADRLGVVATAHLPRSTDAFWKARHHFSLPEGADHEHAARAVRSVFRTLEERASAARARHELAERTEQIQALVEVGIALSAETDPRRLLEMTLTRARGLTGADAGALSIVETTEDGDRLRFVLAQNDSIPNLELVQQTLPIEESSLAGYVAKTGKMLNLPDVRAIPPDAPYRFDDRIDQKHGYRSRSMLVVPLATPGGRIVGVLQLLNRKRRAMPDNTATTAFIRVEVVPFDETSEDLVRTFAAQAAVALENRRLTENIQKLFEGFVSAAVTAIEQRDPTTSGHSERVARLACGLAEAADRMSQGPLAPVKVTWQDLRELRYAAVLHDFGKVGVREHVLVKARKLPPETYLLMESRFEQAILSAAAEVWEQAAREGWSQKKVAEAIAGRKGILDRAWHAIRRADEPSLLQAEIGEEVAQLAEMRFRDASGADTALVRPEEVALLSIPQGSLSALERKEIESHVTQSFRFLCKIPWTPDLARVPDWAYAHHEKLDGSGYPRKLAADQIPHPVRMLTISDIFDALAARDRPYKKAVPHDRALDILRAEARRGKIDSDLLQLFIDAKIYETALANA